MSAEILKMIEEVDPNDTAKLDEVDFHTWLYLHARPGIPVAMPSHPKYTRSRDALKAIRPEGWAWDLLSFFNGDVLELQYKGHNLELDEVYSPSLLTEELAELHAIIQAISHERGSHV